MIDPTMDTLERGKVIEGLELDGRPNISDEEILANIRSAIRRHHPQLRLQTFNHERVCLLGSGPSLNHTIPELTALIQDGAKLVTTNGAYHWAIEHNFCPRTQILVDGRPGNVRFLEPFLPRCNYLVSSTCHPDVWDKLEGRPNVFMFHPFTRREDPTNNSPAVAELDAYFLRNWTGVIGGTTVVTRGLPALRTLGYVRFDLFGVDSCYFGDEHHALPQPENDGDTVYRVQVSVPGRPPEETRTFHCAGWHLSQIQDFLRLIRFHGEHFQLAVHGNGLLAYAIQANAAVTAEPLVHAAVAAA